MQEFLPADPEITWGGQEGSANAINDEENESALPHVQVYRDHGRCDNMEALGCCAAQLAGI
jgi:hypothetical protein